VDIYQCGGMEVGTIQSLIEGEKNNGLTGSNMFFFFDKNTLGDIHSK
jgi:hypothetical protein